jgi:hypothetical protein
MDGDAFTVAEVIELRPKAGAPLKLSEVCGTYANLMKRHGVFDAMADQHELEPGREHLQPLGVSLKAVPGGNAGKFAGYTKLRNLLNEGRFRIPAGQVRLLKQLREVCSRPLPGGSLKIWSPRRGGHGDLVSALMNAVWTLRDFDEGGAGISGRGRRALGPASKRIMDDDYDHDDRDDRWI